MSDFKPIDALRVQVADRYASALTMAHIASQFERAAFEVREAMRYAEIGALDQADVCAKTALKQVTGLASE